MAMHGHCTCTRPLFYPGIPLSNWRRRSTVCLPRALTTGTAARARALGGYYVHVAAIVVSLPHPKQASFPNASAMVPCSISHILAPWRLCITIDDVHARGRTISPPGLRPMRMCREPWLNCVPRSRPVASCPTTTSRHGMMAWPGWPGKREDMYGRQEAHPPKPPRHPRAARPPQGSVNQPHTYVRRPWAKSDVRSLSS